jgi:transposase
MSELIELSYKERSELEYLLSQRIESRQYQRVLALLLLDEGESVEEVAEQLRVTQRTVYNWAARFEQRDELSIEERVLDSARSGRPVTAKGIIEPLIEKVIDKDPRKYGYKSTVWTAQLLRRYLKEKKKREVSLRSIGYALSRMEISWKLPRYTLARQDLFWRQAKGGLKRASGHKSARLY